MDAYTTLGVERHATDEDIKRAYRKLAATHHPDKGGDTAKFQEVQQAYETLSDPQKRQQHDNPQQPNNFHFHTGNMGGVPPGFEDMFSAFGFGDIFGQRNHSRAQRNMTLNLHTAVSLEEAFAGKELVATVQLPSGREQIINVKIPPGVLDGTALRLREIGDDRIPGIPRGDIHLTVTVQPSSLFERQGDDLVKTIDISALDAILGIEQVITTIDRKSLSVTIPAGTQPNTILALQGQGMPNMHDNRFRGRLLLRINITIPNDLTDAQKEFIRLARA